MVNPTVGHNPEFNIMHLPCNYIIYTDFNTFLLYTIYICCFHSTETTNINIVQYVGIKICVCNTEFV
jgi:hypothetical protein